MEIDGFEEEEDEVVRKGKVRGGGLLLSDWEVVEESEAG